MLYASNGYKLVSKVFLVVSRTFRVFAMHFEVVDGAFWVFLLILRYYLRRSMIQQSESEHSVSGSLYNFWNFQIQENTL